MGLSAQQLRQAADDFFPLARADAGQIARALRNLYLQAADQQEQLDALPRSEVPEFLTLPQAADRLGIGLRQLQRARDLGELDVFHVGGWTRVRWADLVDWIETKKVPSKRKKG